MKKCEKQVKLSFPDRSIGAIGVKFEEMLLRSCLQSNGSRQIGVKLEVLNLKGYDVWWDYENQKNFTNPTSQKLGYSAGRLAWRWCLVSRCFRIVERWPHRMAKSPASRRS